MVSCWKGLLKVIYSNPMLLQAGTSSTRSGFSKPHPAWIWTLATSSYSSQDGLKTPFYNAGLAFTFPDGVLCQAGFSCIFQVLVSFPKFHIVLTCPSYPFCTVKLFNIALWFPHSLEAPYPICLLYPAWSPYPTTTKQIQSFSSSLPPQYQLPVINPYVSKSPRSPELNRSHSLESRVKYVTLKRLQLLKCKMSIRSICRIFWRAGIFQRHLN